MKKLSLWFILAIAMVMIPSLSAQSSTTYTDNEYQWSVQYPQDWTAEVTITNDNSQPLEVIRKRTVFFSTVNEFVTIDVWQNSTTDLMNWFNQNHMPFVDNPDTANISINGQIAGKDAILFSDFTSAEGDYPKQVAVFQDPQYTYRIEYYASRNGINEAEFRNILTSFQLSGLSGSVNINQLAPIPDEIKNALSPLATNSCGGVTDNSDNMFPCCNGGNCTWWARHKRPDFRYDMYRNARYWYDDAKALGYPVGSAPKAGAVAVWQNGDAGHVAYIEAVHSTTSVNLSQMSWCKYGVSYANNVNPATYESRFVGYIYKKGETPPSGGTLEKPRLYWNQQQATSMSAGSEHRWNYWLDKAWDHYFVIRRTSGNLEFDVLLKNASGGWMYSSSSTNGVLHFPVTAAGGWYYLHVTSRSNTSGNYTMEIKQGIPGNKSLPFNFDTAKGALNWVGTGSFLRTSDFNDNGWRLNATSLTDPFMISPPVSINANNNRYVAVNLRITGFPNNCAQPQLYFNKNTSWGFAEGRSVKAAKITTQDVFQTVFFDMKSNSNWSGTVGRLRLDPLQCSGSPNNSWIRVRSIQVTNKGPITADFSVSPAPYEAGQEVTFTSQVSGSPDELIWDWGDGTSNSSGATATHVYTTPGTYTVTFTARHSLDAEGVGKIITITEPVASCPTDVTNDDMTDVFDIQTIAGAFGATSGDANYNPAYDIDGSGVIDVLDIQLAANNFGQSCV